MFLNALRQQTARAIRTAVDGLHLVSSFDFAALSARSNGAITVQVSGLLLEGALFEKRNKIEEPIELLEGILGIFGFVTVQGLQLVQRPRQIYRVNGASCKSRGQRTSR